jgi:mannose-6-phosphate isomerase-like protein (cupin superfamily)
VSDTPAGDPVVRLEDGAGERLHVAGDVVTVKADGPATGGAYSCFEETSPPGGGPPPHWHAEAELFRVLEGRVAFHDHAGDGAPTVVVAGPGDVVRVPPRRVHTFRNVGDGPCRLFVVLQPAGLVAFFRAVDAATDGDRVPSPQEIVAIGARTGVHFVP